MITFSAIRVTLFVLLVCMLNYSFATVNQDPTFLAKENIPCDPPNFMCGDSCCVTTSFDSCCYIIVVQRMLCWNSKVGACVN